MNLTGIDKVVFGVEDVETCRRFFTDWGLRETGVFDGCPIFETMDGTEVVISRSDDPGLPPAIEKGSTVRRVVWGVGSDDDLAVVRERIKNEQSFAEEDWGPSVTDPNGMRLSFRVSRRQPVQAVGTPLNVLGHTPRIDARTALYDHAEPVKIGHVVFFAPDIMDCVRFYTDILGFIISDSYPGGGYFLRCGPDGGHHDLFLLKTPDGKRGINHVSFTVRDLNEVFGGGMNMNRQGWKTQIGPGLHPISSAYFWYVHCPAGGLAEYYTNEDWCTAAWEAREWERTPENYAAWAIVGGIDPKTRRQAKEA